MLLKHSLKVLVLRELTKHSQLSFADLVVATQATPGNLGKAIERLLATRYILKVPTESRETVYQTSVKGNQAYSVYKSQLK